MPVQSGADNDVDGRRDRHSYGNPERVRVRHVDLDLTVSFERQSLVGTATLTLERRRAGPVVLDTRDLVIGKAEVNGRPVRFELGPKDPILGTPLTVHAPEGAAQVRITYSTKPDATGLQWLQPAQTAGKRHPFLYSQSQAIHARSWIPLQDSPGVRITYTATIRTPPELLAVMSAEMDVHAPRTGEYHFHMPQPIPPYLLALAVGALEFTSIGPRTGVFAEPPLMAKAAREFEDTEKMVEAVESLYGPYRWGRYDLLVLPPSFPFGGMENPRLTFVTPTVIAGDKSLVGLISHELAHSWSGNLVTNATWSDFWLNEGFTTYVENRIQEKVYGRSQADMEAVLAQSELMEELPRSPARDQVLHIDLQGRDPDEGATQVPYVKGALFLRQLEHAFGRPSFDQFVRAYFDHFAFQSITTADFEQYLREHLLRTDLEKAREVPIRQWIEEPGLPASAPHLKAAAFDPVDQAAANWLQGQVPAAQINSALWSTQQFLRFLDRLPSALGADRLNELDAHFQFTRTGNNEVLSNWLQIAIDEKYEPAYPRVEEFLLSVGRRKYIKPLYKELIQTPEGRDWARRIYAQARPLYHPIAVHTIDSLLK